MNGRFCDRNRGRQKQVKNFISKKVMPLALGAVLFALCLPATAQQPRTKVPRIALPSGQPLFPPTRIAPEAFRQGLRELGYDGGEKHCH